jgi:hypothetical protein
LPAFPRPVRTAITAAMLGTAAFAASADARVVNVGASHTIAVFHSIDFVAAFGDSPGTGATVEVLRNGQLLGTATGPAVELGEHPAPNDGGLEVNHGPAGAPQPGDCWEGFTPDIIPGDIIRVTRGASTEEVEVDDITIDEGSPFLDAAGNVVLTGHAALADGTPMAIADLDSGEVRNTSSFRGVPTQIFRTPGTTDGWTAVYDPKVPLERERDLMTPAERRDTIMAGDHAMGFGHVAVPPGPEIQLFEGGNSPGPALGCEAFASESNRVDTLDDKSVNLASADLVVTGKAMAATVDNDITEVTPRVTDGTTTITGTPIDVTGDVRDWTATFTRAQLDTLADGKLTVAADYVTADGPIGGGTQSLVKDTLAPDVTPDKAPGAYTGPLSVALSAGAGDKITYRTDGGANGPNDRAYSGPIALPFGTTTIAARVTDAAGNVVDKAFTYTVSPVAAPAVAPVVIQPSTTPAAPSLTASLLKASKRVKLRTVRKSGLRVSFQVPSGAKAGKARLYRKVGNRKVRLSSKNMTLRGGRRAAVTFRPTKPGLYINEIRLGASLTSLGAAKTVNTRVIR